MVDDFSALEKMVYSGRGIVIGKTPTGNPFIGYSLTGRSPSSQARRLAFDLKTGVVRTEVTDQEQLSKGSPALLLYPAIAYAANSGGTLIASNGAQTKLIYSEAVMSENANPREVLIRAFSNPFFEYDEKEDRWIDVTTFEPDSPNYTPRISACVRKENYGAFHIVWSEGERKKQRFISCDLEEGRAKLITTYNGGNESPLRPFSGEPFDFFIESETSQEIAESIYSAIGGRNGRDNYRVAAAVQMITPERLETAIINRIDRGN